MGYIINDSERKKREKRLRKLFVKELRELQNLTSEVPTCENVLKLIFHLANWIEDIKKVDPELTKLADVLLFDYVLGLQKGLEKSGIEL